MHTRAWVALAVLAGLVVWSVRSLDSSARRARSSEPTPARADLSPTDDAAPNTPLRGAPAELQPAATRAEPPSPDRSATPPAAERTVVRRWSVTVRDERGAPIAGARLDVDVHDAPAALASGAAGHGPLEVTLGAERVPSAPRHSCDAGGPEPIVVAALAPAPERLLFRAFADGWQPETRVVPVSDGAVDDTLAFVLRPGASISGRLVDRDGRRVLKGRLTLASAQGGKQFQALTTDHEGRFEAPVRKPGELVADVVSDGVGCSEPRTLFLPEGRRTEVGDIVLLGPGRISGVARLGDGTPLARVTVTANIEGSAQGAGLREARAVCDGEGRFELGGLAVGSYRLAVAAEPLAALDANRTPVATGTERYTLVVDALLATLRALDDEAEVVPIVSIEASSIGGLDTPAQAEDNLSVSSQMAFSAPRPSQTWLIASTRSYLLRAVGEDGVGYFAFLAAGQPSRQVTLDLVARPRELGSILLRAENPALPAEATLEVRSLITSSRHVNLITRPTPAAREQGAPLTREVTGLLPGRYELSLALTGAGAVALAEDEVSVLVTAGAVNEVTLETFAGGTLALAVESPLSGAGPTLALVESRPVGADVWQPLTLTVTETSGAERVGTHVRLVGGAHTEDGSARSGLMAPGDHELRLSADGHRVLLATCRIEAGRQSSLRLQMTPSE